MFCQYAIITELTDLRPAATASFSLWKQSGSSSSYRFEWENYILVSRLWPFVIEYSNGQIHKLFFCTQK